MDLHVIKRDGTREPFSKQKLELAIYKAIVDSAAPSELSEGYDANKIASKAATYVEDTLKQPMMDYHEELTTEDVMRVSEATLMRMKYFDAARALILYREHNKPDIFRRRTTFKPYEYPALYKYVEAIRHSYWLHTEFNYTSDMQDINVNMSNAEKTAATRSMLAISQIEVDVKTFWGKIGEVLPKPEIQAVGATFAESEVRHADAYANLLEILGLNEEFTQLKNVPAIDHRIQYLKSALVKPASNEDYFYNVILFSMLIENVSLFSQFYILMSFNKHKGYLKGISNAISGTSKEELIHAQFGFDVVNIIKKENPSWWTEETKARILDMVKTAYEAELKILDWIFEEGDFDYLTKAECAAFLEYRIHDSLKNVGIDYQVSPELALTDIKSKFEWFNVEMTSTSLNDGFNKRFTNYTKRETAITKEDLF